VSNIFQCSICIVTKKSASESWVGLLVNTYSLYSLYVSYFYLTSGVLLLMSYSFISHYALISNFTYLFIHSLLITIHISFFLLWHIITITA